MRKLLFIAPLALFFFACSNDNATQKKDVDNDMFGSSATAEKDEDYKRRVFEYECSRKQL